jgi:hypothetical protein
LTLAPDPPQRENVWRFFRFTQRTSRQSLLWGALVPLGVFAICQQQDVSDPSPPTLLEALHADPTHTR